MARVSLFYIIFLLSHPFVSFSQKASDIDSHRWMIGGGPILTKGFVTDDAYSLLPYSGISAGAKISAIYEGKRVMHFIDIGYIAGVYKATHQNAYQLKNRYINFDYSLLAQINSAGALHWYVGAGAAINFLYADRNYNNFINSHTAFEFASSLSVSARLKYKFGSSSYGFFLYDNIQIPVITYLVQPPYGYNNLVASGKGVFYSKDFVSASSFFRFNNCIGIGKSLDNKQQLSLNYQWDFYHLQKEREIRSAAHSVLITYSHSL